MTNQGSIQLLSAQSMGATFQSMGIFLANQYAYSIQGVWSGGGSPIGTFKLQGSNDSGDIGSGQGVSQPINWTDIADSSQAITGDSGSILYDVTQCSYRFVRIVYTRGSGTATFSAMMQVKG